LCGDFNIDILKHDNHQHTRLIIVTMFTLGLLPLISVPTRIISASETLIDNIFTNVLSTKHYSDHLPIFTINESELSPNRHGTQIYRRIINDRTLRELNSSLKCESWLTVFNSDNANKSYEEFIKIFMQKSG
jgi:hypothetical protein